MFSRAGIVGGLCVAVALGGCSLAPSKTSSNGGFTGERANVATALNQLASDASSANGSDICKTVLAQAVRSKLNRIGSCEKIIDNQLKTSDDFTLTIKKIEIAGKTATARVQTQRNGNKVTSTVSLLKQNGLWRLASI